MENILQTAVKAVGDWEVEIRAVPYGMDSDQQMFDAYTDYMLDTFPSPAILYHHGVNPGKGSLQDKPVVIGKSQNVEQRADGVWIRALLDKGKDFAKRVWEAAQKGTAVASSDSIAHLARLDVAGKRIMYEKGRPGRIAVWPLAGVSLWDSVPENFRPASRNAIALPAMKAIYRDAGLLFPDIDTGGGVSVVPDGNAERRARIEVIQQQARQYLAKTKR
jgi:hypothetical protein